MFNNRKNIKGFYFEWKVFEITIKQIKPIIWISLLIAIFGAINYEGQIITIKSNNKFIIGLNSVVYQIFIAYFTGFTLFFLFELLYRTKKRISVSTSVGNNILLIKERVEYILNEIGKKNNTALKEFLLTEDQLRTCCEKINVDTELTKVWYYPDYTFRQFISKSCDEIKRAADEILSFSDAFDEKWVYSLSIISGLSDKVSKSLDIRFPNSQIEFYWLWGLYGETGRVMQLLSKFNEDCFQLARLSAPPFHPLGLKFIVKRDK